MLVDAAGEVFVHNIIETFFSLNNMIKQFELHQSKNPNYKNILGNWKIRASTQTLGIGVQ